MIMEKRFSPLALVLASIFAAFLTSLIMHFSTTKTRAESFDSSVSRSACGVDIRRAKKFKFIHPILFVDTHCESEEWLLIKGQLEKVIDVEKLSGHILSASVHLREFENARWITVNPKEKYNPGSVLKIPQLMALYRMEEKAPGFLNKAIFYNQRLDDNRNVNFESQHIQPGQSYTIRELMRRMIQYSDNEATMLLSTQMDTLVMNEVFLNLGLPKPSYKSRYYPASVEDISLFMRSLYNASILNYEHSEACLALLSQTEFKEGLIKGLPAGVPVSHKFGESGYDNQPELSETAIVYSKNRAYLISVMTRGGDLKVQAQSIARIASAAHEAMMTSL